MTCDYDQEKKYYTMQREFVDACILNMTVETTGYCGGDAGHGGSTKVAFSFGSPAMIEGGVNAKNEFNHECDHLQITLRGDAELHTLARAFLVAGEFLQQVSKL